MESSDYRGAPSTAAIAGHPIHPMLVVFPIGFLVGALGTDLAFWGTSDPFWARASEWLLGAGVVMGVLAAAAGLIEFVTISRVRALAVGWIHFLGNATAVLLALWNLLRRIGGDYGTMVARRLSTTKGILKSFGVRGVQNNSSRFEHGGNQMRPIVAPPPSLRCECGGELRLKLVEPVGRHLRKQHETFVCIKCSRERTFIAEANPYVSPGTFP